MFKKLIKVFTVVLLIIAMACGMIACDSGSDDDDDKKKTMKPSEEAFKAAYGEVVTELLAGLDKSYANAGKYSLQDLGMSSTVTVNISTELNNLLRSLTGYDFAWVNGLSYTTSQNFKGDLLSTATNVAYNGTQFLSASAIFDLVSGSVYLGIPEMNATYLKQSFADIDDMEEIVSILKVLTSTDFTKALPDKSVLKALLSDITEAIIDSVEDVEFEESTITANGVSQDCVEYVVEIGTKDLVNLAKNVLKELQNNKNLDSLVNHFVNYAKTISGQLGVEMDPTITPEAVTSMISSAIANVLTQIDSATASMPDMKLATWTSYITKDLEILGTKIDVDLTSVTGDSTAGNASVYIATATDGNDVGAELSVTVAGVKYAEIVGDLTKSGKTLSGTCNVKVQGQSYAVIELANVNTSGEYFTGAITVSPSSMLLNMLTSEFGDELAEIGINLVNPGIKIDVQENNGSKFKLSVSVMNNGSAYASFGVEGSIGKAQSITKPGSTTTDIESWSESFTVNKITNILSQAGLPSYLVDLIKGSAQAE